MLEEIDTIEEGMTRDDLLQVFDEEGGFSTPLKRTYVYRGCHMIKVDARFQVRHAIGEHLDDKIVKLSRPYLARAISD